MQKVNIFGKMLALVALIGLSLTFASFGPAARAADFNPQPDPPGFGMMGVADGQTARLNVTIDLDPTRIPPDPYRVTLYFLNGDGRILTQQTFSLAVRQSAFLDYAAPRMPLGARQRIRPVAIAEPDANGIVPCIKPVVEVINNDTQRNAFVYVGQHNPPSNIVQHNPPAFYDSGVVGIARGQAARLNVVNTSDIYRAAGVPPDPCLVTLSFYGSDGTLLAQTTKTLLPGQAASLDVNAFNFAPNQGARLQVRAVVTVTPGPNGIAPCVMPTIEGFNLADGKTAFLVPAV